jgi:hypothetical protein
MPDTPTNNPGGDNESQNKPPSTGKTPTLEELQAMLATARKESLDRNHLKTKIPHIEAGRGKVTIQIRGEGTCDEEGLNGRFVPSKIYRNATWKITKDEEGNENYELTGEHMYRPVYAGPTQEYAKDSGYDPSCRKPFKVIQIRKHLGKLDFPIEYVDYEMYGVLKLFMAGRVVTKDTMMALRNEALRYLRQFKMPHLDALLLSHVVDSTVTLAMMADTTTAKRLARLWKWKLVRATQKRNKTLTTGVIHPKWWAFWREDAKLYHEPTT